MFEGLCSDYIELFARQPDLWRQAPSVFSALSQTEWRAEVCSARDQLRRKEACATSATPSENSGLICRIEKRLRVYVSLLRGHCDTFRGSDLLDEVPNPCDGQVSKRTWERQAMLCREKLRLAKEGQDADVEASVPLLDLQAGRQGNSRGASSDDDAEGGEPAEPRFVIDDEGQITFQDIIKDSLEEEVHAFIAEVERNNIRKIHDAYCCPFCPFRAFGRLLQLSDHPRRHHVATKQFFLLRNQAGQGDFGFARFRLCPQRERCRLSISKRHAPQNSSSSSTQLQLDDGWPESVEEQGLLLLVWRQHITEQYIQDVL